MTKHHIEDVSEDVRLRVAYIAGGPPAHAKNEKTELYPAFAANIVENQRRWANQEHMVKYAAAAAAVMDLSGGEWSLDWRV